MTKRFSILLVALTIVSGLIGGAITGRIFTPKVAVAEETTQGKVLTVEELRVVDESGKLLMKLGKKDTALTPYGLFIYDNSGEFHAVMGVDESGGSVNVFGKDNEIGVMMNTNESGGIVAVASKGGKVGVGMSANESGGHVSVFGKDGNSKANIGIIETGGYVNVCGKDSKSSDASMSVNE
jgi:hypothetical protein